MSRGAYNTHIWCLVSLDTTTTSVRNTRPDCNTSFRSFAGRLGFHPSLGLFVLSFLFGFPVLWLGFKTGCPLSVSRFQQTQAK